MVAFTHAQNTVLSVLHFRGAHNIASFLCVQMQQVTVASAFKAILKIAILCGNCSGLLLPRRQLGFATLCQPSRQAVKLFMRSACPTVCSSDSLS